MTKSDSRPADSASADLDAACALRTSEDSRQLYRDWAASYDADFAETRGYAMPARVAAAFAEAAQAGSAAEPTADIGCGTGLVGRELARRVA